MMTFESAKDKIMDTRTRQLLDEMVRYASERQPGEYFRQAYDALGEEELYRLNGYLLQWHKGVARGMEKPDRFDISEALFVRYARFLEECPELKTILALYPDHIGWAPGLSPAEQAEIRSYLDDNYRRRLRTYLNPK